MEFLYTFNRNVNMDWYDTEKLLALVKYQLEEATKNTGRSIVKFKEKFSKSTNSDPIWSRKSSNSMTFLTSLSTNNTNYILQLMEIKYGLQEFGNFLFAGVFKKHLEVITFFISSSLKLRKQYFEWLVNHGFSIKRCAKNTIV